MYKAFYILGTISLFWASQSMAADCASLPSCEAMGYKKGFDSLCGEDLSNYVVCPYDTEYRKCINYTCAGLGFTNTDKTAWCADIKACPRDGSLTLCARPR